MQQTKLQRDAANIKQDAMNIILFAPLRKFTALCGIFVNINSLHHLYMFLVIINVRLTVIKNISLICTL